MKPIWIVDDDQSIRWVLEKALARESLLSRSFTTSAMRSTRWTKKRRKC
jgi:two-component system nitrogen regulation response regulator GlnG